MTHYDTVVVGGGIAGLSIAALLSKRNEKICLVEKSLLGGRAITLDMKGYRFNFGAHAVYGLDRSIWTRLQNDLNLNIEWSHYDPKRTFYHKDEKLYLMPSDMNTFFETKLLTFKGKIQFIKLMLNIITMNEVPEETLSQWLNKQKTTQLIKDSFLHLVSSNFFLSNPKDMPMKTIVPYYKKLFTSQTGVSYIKGGWGKFITELENVILTHGGVIRTKEGVKTVEKTDNKIDHIITNKGEKISAKKYIFAIPPKELSKIFNVDENVSKVNPLNPNEVMYFDIGLSEKIQTKYSYIKDWGSKIFLSDVSHYDSTLVPEGGQLIQVIAYLEHNASQGEKDKLEEKMKDLLTKFFPGWEEKLVVKRLSKKAIIQEVSPVYNAGTSINRPDLENAYFVGEWTDVPGSLSEKSIQSVYECLDSLAGNKSL